jgi:hypothetical protein
MKLLYSQNMIIIIFHLFIMIHDHNKIIINVDQMIKLQWLKQTENRWVGVPPSSGFPTALNPRSIEVRSDGLRQPRSAQGRDDYSRRRRIAALHTTTTQREPEHAWTTSGPSSTHAVVEASANGHSVGARAHDGFYPHDTHESTAAMAVLGRVAASNGSRSPARRTDRRSTVMNEVKNR